MKYLLCKKKKKKSIQFLASFNQNGFAIFCSSFSRLLSLCLISHGWFIWARIIGLICIAGINYFRVPAVSLAHPTGEEAGLRLLGAVRRGAAGSGSALHLHLSARVKGTCNVSDVSPIETSVYRFDWTVDSSDRFVSVISANQQIVKGLMGFGFIYI